MSHNTSALTISNFRRSTIEAIDFKTYTPNYTYTNQTISNYVYSPLYSASVQPNNTFRASSLVIRTSSSNSYSANDVWDLTLFLYTFMDSYRGLNGETVIPTVLCPTFSNSGNTIDDCDIEYHDMINSPIDLTPLSTTTPTPDLPAGVQNKIHGYYAVKLKGHFTSNGSGNAMALSGPFLAVLNPTIQALSFDYLIGFSNLRIYTEVESAEDEVAQKELESTNNIENQSESDAQGSTNSQTTSLINTLNGFVSAFSNIQASPNCNMTLPFPEFFGGDTNVNICQGKDKAPALISIGSSILLITTFVPLAYILIKMIYNEIRSWTNG